jgi:hypothetical protein
VLNIKTNSANVITRAVITLKSLYLTFIIILLLVQSKLRVFRISRGAPAFAIAPRIPKEPKLIDIKLEKENWG